MVKYRHSDGHCRSVESRPSTAIPALLFVETSMKSNLLLLFTLFLLCSVPSVYLDPIAAQEKKGTPEEKSVKPGVNKDFLNPDLSIEEFLGKFEVESREVYTHREKTGRTSGAETGNGHRRHWFGYGRLPEDILDSSGKRRSSLCGRHFP